ncbi:MAG: DegT/DnrJ/EryC1/StrS family aminotransferase [Desulfatibacillaceae bacterium]
MPGFEVFGDEERKEVQDVLDTGVLFRYGFDQARNGHWKARTFEEEFAKRCKVRYCHMCSSGTAAVHTALAVSGVGAGDEVILPPFTFVASVEAVLALGAVPVYAEIDETLCLDPDNVRRQVTEKTRAVMPVHMCGSMARIEELKEICDNNGLALVEDACQSIGGTFKGKSLGTFGTAGCFSLDPVKTITAGEGGAVVSDHEKVYESIHRFCDHGHDHIGNDRGTEAHPIIGFNYRISELNAAVGLAQLRKLDMILSTQRRNKEVLKRAFSQFDDVIFRTIPDPQGDTATFLCFFMPDEKSARDTVDGFKKEGVPGVFYWYANNWHYHLQWEHFASLSSPSRLAVEALGRELPHASANLPVSDRIMARTVCMLINLSWTEDDLEERIRKIETVFGK